MHNDFSSLLGISEERMQLLYDRHYDQEKSIPEVFLGIMNDVHLTTAERCLLQLGLGYMKAKSEVMVIKKDDIIQ